VKIPFGKIAVIGAFAAMSVTPAAAVAASGGNGVGHGQAGQHGQAGDHGKSGSSHGKAKGKSKVHNVTYVFKGTWNASAGTLTVTSGNHHVRKAGFVGQDVQFDLTNARLVVADTNGDGQITAADLKDGDHLVVKARLPRKDPGSQPFKAKMAIDQTNAPASSGDSSD
jgi:hypothetical protein